MEWDGAGPGHELGESGQGAARAGDSGPALGRPVALGGVLQKLAILATLEPATRSREPTYWFRG